MHRARIHLIGSFCLAVGAAQIGWGADVPAAAPAKPEATTKATVSVKADGSKSDSGKPKSSTPTWGQVEITGSYPESATPPGLFGELHEGLTDGIARLQKAADDDNLKGIILKINGPQIGWAKLSEFRKAIAKVRAKGKTVHAWMDGGSSMDYLLATSCDKISMPESAALMLLGLRA